jgi:hypothetical protein
MDHPGPGFADLKSPLPDIRLAGGRDAIPHPWKSRVALRLVHDRELTRLRAELDARQGPARPSGIDKMIIGLKRRFGKKRED